MKGVTLTQPWATLVAQGEKRIETRSWSTRYRGPLLIHAAKAFPPEARELCLQEPFAAALRRAGYGGLALSAPDKALPRGAVVAVCALTNVISTASMQPEDASVAIGFQERAFGNYEPGRYAWVLEEIVALRRPIEARGALGLWAIPAALEALVRFDQALRTPAEARAERQL